MSSWYRPAASRVLTAVAFVAAFLAPIACGTDRAVGPASPLANVSPAGSVVLVGAGNVARCGVSRDEATAELINSIPGTVFTTGDNVYSDGSSSDYTKCYGPSWGRHKSRTRPAPGDNEYQTSGASGYFSYFGASAGPSGKGYYSYDLGDWHVVVLNTSLATSAGSAQEQWLLADLAASTKACTIGIFHHPYFSSYGTSVRSGLKPLWDALYAAGAEVVLNAHYRHYERFAPQTPTGAADPATGIRQFIVGTGGQGSDGFGTVRPNSEVRKSGVYGVLKLVLSNSSYSWQFVPTPGQSFTDSGSGTCHSGLGSASLTSSTVSSVQTTPVSISLATGGTAQLTAVAKDAAGNTIANAPMTWSSTASSVATVSGTGLVTALAVGTAYVVATSGGKADTTTVNVTNPPASISVTPASASFGTGMTQIYTATARDASGNIVPASIVWSSSNPAVASVSSGGTATGLSAGTATIRATSGSVSGSATATITSTPSVRPGYYVAPNGSSLNDGSYSRPWNLATALSGAGGKVRPGDTVWVRGGTYVGTFRSSLTGTSSAPVVVRAYPGERAIIDGSASQTTSTFYVGGQWSVYWGLEFTNSYTNRVTSSTANNVRPNVVVNYASNTRYVNLIIHDGGVAFYTDPVYSNVEIVGSIIYNNGWQGPDRGHGHAIYLKSNTGPVVARENIMFNQFGYGIHGYTNAGSGKLNNIQLTGNIAFNNGTLASNSTSSNILLGGADTGTGDVVRDNFAYFSPSVSGTNMKIGYGTVQNGDVRVERNYIAGGAPVFDFGFWNTATVGGNTFIGASSVVRLNDASKSGKSWSSNVHQRDPMTTSWRYSSTTYTFSNWRSAVGYAATDQAYGGLPTSTKVVVRRNPYEAGRANIVVYNWGRLGSVSADLSTVLASGERFAVYNVQDLFGTPVVSGTYAGGSVLLPMSGVAPPAPVGMSSRAPRTGPDFDVFVVVKL